MMGAGGSRKKQATETFEHTKKVSDIANIGHEHDVPDPVKASRKKITTTQRLESTAPAMTLNQLEHVQETKCPVIENYSEPAPEKSRRSEKKRKGGKKTRDRSPFQYEVTESSSDPDMRNILSELEADLPPPTLPAPPPSLAQSRSHSQTLSENSPAVSEDRGLEAQRGGLNKVNGFDLLGNLQTMNSSNSVSNSNSATKSRRRRGGGAKSPKSAQRNDNETAVTTDGDKTNRDSECWAFKPKQIDGFDLDKFQAANQKRQKKEIPVFDYDLDYDYLDEFSKDANQVSVSKVKYDPSEEALLASIEHEYGNRNGSHF